MTARIYNVRTKGMRIGPNEAFLGPQPVTDAGVFFPEYGGYYAGANIVADGTEYAIIIAPRSGGETSVTGWSTNSINYSGMQSKNNGKQNMQDALSNGISSFLSFQFCYNLELNGFSDWHLPSGDELEVCYRYLKPTSETNKTFTLPYRNAGSGLNPSSIPTGDSYTTNDPTQTSVSEFQTGGSQAFDEGARYWTSTESDDLYSFQMDFGDGRQLQGSKTGSGYNVRAVRWVEV